MSPTEDDLRRALADGERNDVPNANRIIAAANERRGRRRRTLLSAAAAVIVVGGVAAGVTALSGGDSSQDSGATGGGGNGGARSADSRAAAGSAPAAAACPVRPPHLVNSLNTNQSSKLFAHTVSSATVCAYPSVGTGPTRRIHLSGTDATTFAASMEDASKTISTRGECSDLRQANQQTIVVLALTAEGTSAGTVVTTINEPACAVRVTNGNVTRYEWTWPVSLARQLALLEHSGASPDPSVPGLRRDPSPPNK